MDSEKSQQLLLPCFSTIHFYSWTSHDLFLWRPQLSPFCAFPQLGMSGTFVKASVWVTFLANNQSQLAMICANLVSVLTGKTEPRTFYLFYWPEKTNCHVVPGRLKWPENYYLLRSQYLNGSHVLCLLNPESVGYWFPKNRQPDNCVWRIRW